MEKYRFRRYRKDFLLLYRGEFAKLRRILPRSASIEHVGSTAVEGLGGKGIIDIVIAIPKSDITKANGLLEDAQYEFRTDAGDRDRLFFNKDYVSRGKMRRVHLHLTYYNSKAFIEMVAVRDYLRSNRCEVRRYEEVKRKAARIARGSGEEYKRLKKEYLKSLTKKAVDNRSAD